MDNPTYQIFTLMDQHPHAGQGESFTLKRIFAGMKPFTDYDDAVRWIETRGQRDDEYVVLTVYKR